MGLSGRSNQSVLKEISLKGNQPWIFTGRTDAEAEAPILGHLMLTADSLENTLMLRKIEGRRRRGQQRMKWLDGIIGSMAMSFEQTPGVSEGQGSLACCSWWGRKELDMTVQLNSNNIVQVNTKPGTSSLLFTLLYLFPNLVWDQAAWKVKVES